MQASKVRVTENDVAIKAKLAGQSKASLKRTMPKLQSTIEAMLRRRRIIVSSGNVAIAATTARLAALRITSNECKAIH